MKIKKIFFWKICKKIYYKLKYLHQKHLVKFDLLEEEHAKQFGNKFPDKTFYIIRRRPPACGLLSNFHWVLNHTIYSISKGFIPVVDMENYKTFYSENFPVETGNGKTLNSWEYYFQQPCGYSLTDIKKAKKVIFCELKYFVGELQDVANETCSGTIAVSKYHSFLSQYFKFNQKTTEYMRNAKERFFTDKKNILGVLHRGTDMKITKAHYTPASIDQTLQKTQEIFQKENFDYIFLLTEEQEALDKFYEIFNRKEIIVNDQQRIKGFNGERGVPDIIQRTSPSAYKSGLDYLTGVYLLSQCDGIIAPKVNGTYFALGLNNNKYRYSYIFDLGINL